MWLSNEHVHWGKLAGNYYTLAYPVIALQGHTHCTRLGDRVRGCYGQVVREVDAPVGFRVFDKQTSDFRIVRIEGWPTSWLVAFFYLKFRVFRV